MVSAGLEPATSGFQVRRPYQLAMLLPQLYLVTYNKMCDILLSQVLCTALSFVMAAWKIHLLEHVGNVAFVPILICVQIVSRGAFTMIRIYLYISANRTVIGRCIDFPMLPCFLSSLPPIPGPSVAPSHAPPYHFALLYSFSPSCHALSCPSYTVLCCPFFLPFLTNTLLLFLFHFLLSFCFSLF